MEEWKDIVGYERLYQISSQGRVKNNKGKIMAQRKDKDGHPVVIGELPLTASPVAREKELREYVTQNYNGEMPKHLLPVIRNINAEKNASMSRVMANSKGNEGN